MCQATATASRCSHSPTPNAMSYSEPQFSYYTGNFNTPATEQIITPNQLHFVLLKRRKTRTKELRSLDHYNVFESHEERLEKARYYRRLRSTFDFVIPSGTFVYNSGYRLAKHSGILKLTFTLESVDPEILLNKLLSNNILGPSICQAFTSVCGRLKHVLVEIDLAFTHRQNKEAIYSYLKVHDDWLSNGMDMVWEGIKRPCIIGHDPDPYIKLNYHDGPVPFPIEAGLQCMKELERKEWQECDWQYRTYWNIFSSSARERIKRFKALGIKV